MFFNPFVVVQQDGGDTTVVSQKDVNFYDYDGTLLHSYTVDEIQELTELPELPSHAGLVCQGWNWTLDDLKTTNRAMNVGAMYITDDGKTRLYIRIDNADRASVKIYIEQSVRGDVTIDWGDGSETETFNADDTESRQYIDHTYAHVGDYTITLDPKDDCELKLGRYWQPNSGSYTGTYTILGESSTSTYFYLGMLKKIEIGRNVTTIYHHAFNHCRDLSSITIPREVTNIGEYAFRFCQSLIYITIPNNVTAIGNYTFNMGYSGKLVNVSIPNSITSIGNYAFVSNCHLDGVTIPDSVTSVGNYVFQHCYGLRSIIIPKGITTIPQYMFQYCYGLTDVIIQDGIISIGTGAFDSCSMLDNVIIPESVTSIGASAFRSCNSIRDIIIPDSVTSIGAAFYSCFSMTSIIMSGNITNIVSGMFSSCCMMASYDFTRHTSVPTLANTSVFNDIPDDCKILVPLALIDEWKAATNWATYADYIVGV